MYYQLTPLEEYAFFYSDNEKESNNDVLAPEHSNPWTKPNLVEYEMHEPSRIRNIGLDYADWRIRQRRKQGPQIE